jgi:hypothetical protein
MCLDCGCGELHNNHGNPLHITIGRFRLVSQLNNKSMYQTALTIVATLIGLITKKNTLGTDKLVGDPKRVEVKPETEPKYVKMGVPAKSRETRVRRERREEKEREDSR